MDHYRDLGLLILRAAWVAILGVMVVATIEQFGREMPQPEHALKNASSWRARSSPGQGDIRSPLGRRR